MGGGLLGGLGSRSRRSEGYKTPAGAGGGYGTAGVGGLLLSLESFLANFGGVTPVREPGLPFNKTITFTTALFAPSLL